MQDDMTQQDQGQQDQSGTEMPAGDQSGAEGTTDAGSDNSNEGGESQA